MRKSPLLLVLMCCSIFSISQKSNDLEVWAGIGLKFKLNKKYTLYVNEQIRLNNVVTSIRTTFSDLGLRYKLNKWIDLQGNVRFNLNPSAANKARASFDVNYGWSKKKFPLSFGCRSRIQNVTTLVNWKNQTYLREKIGVGYNMSKLVDPYFAYEIFFQFNGRYKLNKARTTAGLNWRLGKCLKLKTFYRLQSEIFTKNGKRQHILGLGLSASFKKKKNDKGMELPRFP
ncbi:DUF2490 domain-containing protein [Crocinitomix catalasitica]|nr:DUF2490 domain-containing protein [Crocinitomix catalasitica]